MSGHLTGFFSILEKLSFFRSFSIEIFPTDDTYAVNLILFKTCFAIAPPNTLDMVSLAELLPPPLKSLIPYFFS